MKEQERSPLAIISEIIAEEADINPADVTEETSLDDDLELDKNSIMQILVACEVEFGIEYEQADFEDIRSVADILRSLEEW
ncbi:MAG: acyl carrier protein [Firmicutes bacterium]|nr:acyl carrier protein [Bacillota bacterium]MBQ7059126.1 acyl carrier protein [Bacillota bacterium]